MATVCWLSCAVGLRSMISDRTDLSANVHCSPPRLVQSLLFQVLFHQGKTYGNVAAVKHPDTVAFYFISWLSKHAVKTRSYENVLWTRMRTLQSVCRQGSCVSQCIQYHSRMFTLTQRVCTCGVFQCASCVLNGKQLPCLTSEYTRHSPSFAHRHTRRPRLSTASLQVQ